MADGTQDDPQDSGQTPSFSSLARGRDALGRFVKATENRYPAPDPETYYEANVGPDVIPSSAPDPSALSAEPMEKWAGQPQPGGMGGSYNSPSPAEDKYDPEKKPGPFTEVGASGLAQYGGFVRDEFLLQLQGNSARKIFREMWDNDPVVGALVFAVQMLVRKVEWRVEPPEAATVEQIVEARIQERQSAVMERQQAQQQQLMEAQAGLAANNNSPTRSGPDGKPASPMPAQLGPKPSMAQGPLQQTGQIHEPLAQHSNLPATPNAPGSNPSGAVAQDAALAPGSEDGLPTTGSKPRTPKSSLGMQKAAQRSILARARDYFMKSGTMTGSLDFQDVDANAPVDPETGEAMEFATGESPMDVSPEARENEELAVFVETCFHDMADSWSDCLAQIITMIVFGFSYHELVYKKRNGPNPDYPEQGSRFSDGKIGWAKVAGRAQETLHRWEFDEHGNVIGFWQLAPPKFKLKYIPLSKALLFRTTAYKNNPEGRSILRSAYRPWFFKKRIEEYEAIGVERDLAGLPVAKVPYQYMTPSATGEEQAALNEIKKIVRNLRRNEQEGVVFPTMYDPETKGELFTLELLASPSRRQFDTNVVITRYEQRIAMNALADFILLGHDSVGARSLGETKVDLFTTALEAWLNAIADVFNTYAIPRLMQINGEDPAKSPRLTFGKIDSVPLADVASMITSMAGAGATLFPDTQLEDHLRESVGWPPKAASSDL